MKKILLLLGLFAVTCSGAYAAGDDKGVSDEDIQQIVRQQPQWGLNFRTYLEREDFDNKSPLIRSDDEDGLFWGVGLTATKDKWSFDLAAERRWGGTWNSPDYDNMRVDYKLRYQVIPQLGLHLKYRSENKDRDYDKETYVKSATRDRFELGSDFNFFKGYLSGWLVAGHDDDKFDKVDANGYINSSTRDNGEYWEGDFGPTFVINDKISLRPTIYTTGEYYQSYRMTEEQLRLMATFKITDKIDLMPRVRITLDKNLRNKPNTETGYDVDFGGRIRYELLSNVKVSDKMSLFLGVAYDDQDRKIVSPGEKTGGKDIDMWWWITQISYSF